MHLNTEHLNEEFTINVTNHTSWPVTYDRHWHDHYELYFLFYGSVNFLIEDSIYPIGQNELAWIPPSVPHIPHPNRIESHRRLVFKVKSDCLEQCLSKELLGFFSKPRIITITPQYEKKFNKLCNLLLDEYLEEQPDYQLAIRSFLTSILILLKRIDSCKTKNADKKIFLNPEVKLLINFINENFRTDITLPLLAQQISLSPTYVSTLFKEITGVNFKQYLMDTRINHAMKLLQNSNHTIAFIADECGFNSVNNFCKAFKKNIGLSPGMFRSIGKA